LNTTQNLVTNNRFKWPPILSPDKSTTSHYLVSRHLSIYIKSVGLSDMVTSCWNK